MLRALDKDTVDFARTARILTQPLVLPAVPEPWVNGSNGIAVGMATNIPHITR
jgi:DNA gyrase/topoisomerase IV subunit A